MTRRWPWFDGLSQRATPTRDHACQVRNSFQGLTATTGQYGTIPIFDPVIGWLSDRNDRQACYDAHHAVGDTHVNLALSGQYNEPNQAYEHIPGRDYSNDLPALAGLINEAAGEGFSTVLCLAGDGMGPFDPGGMVYGAPWLLENFQRIHDGLGELDPWIVYCPGYDGVVPAWQPATRVNDWLLHARDVVGPAGHLALELSGGYASWGDGGADWDSPAGLALDTILQEFPYPIEANMNQTWQIAGRLVRPYHRPPDQTGDPNPPYYLGLVTPRGPRYWVAWEYDTYGWVRGAPLSQVEGHRAYLRALSDNTLVG